jgi:phage terminase large subunit-like protein
MDGGHVTNMAGVDGLISALGGGFKASYFADEGPFSRFLFPQSMAAIEATARYKNVNMFGANRSAKSITLSYMFACWAEGDYPEWWNGWVLHKPGRFWLAGETSTLVQNNLQRYLIGSKGEEGQNCFIKSSSIQNVDYHGDFAKKILIQSKYGGTSVIELKTYDQDRKRFASDTLDGVGLDEEPKGGIFSESITRTGTTQGKVVCAFTALKGVTPLVEKLAPEFAGGEAEDPEVTSRKTIIIGWSDIPYGVLSKREREILKASYEAHEVIARTTGVPSVGKGLVYPISESEFVIPDFPIPDHWPRLVTLDPGFTVPTAAAWWAYNADEDAMYQYAEHYLARAEYSIHVDAIHSKGDWIPLIIDYAGGNILDGEQVAATYRKKLRNPVINANKSRSAGHMAVWDRLQTQRWFVFESLRHSRHEFRQYHRDEKGMIAKTPQHIMDNWRYAATGIQHAKQRPVGYRFNGESMRAPNLNLPVEELRLTEGLWS